ncbi:MAG TPA: hypothetical protein VMS64_16740 [Candidatus Methylomirabilis sp.]|nr:hypothetical protein [Candidatus Methylomirabilis sp.]
MAIATLSQETLKQHVGRRLVATDVATATPANLLRHTFGRAEPYTTQARAPLFDTAPFELRGRPTADGRGADLWAVTPEGTVAMSAQAEFQGD